MTINTKTEKCPNCDAPATYPQLHERCRRASAESNDAASLIETCIHSKMLREHINTQTSEDPCQFCSFNEVTETPGSYLHSDFCPENGWIMHHLCIFCSTEYHVLSNNC